MPLDPVIERVAEAIYESHRDITLPGPHDRLPLTTPCSTPPPWFWLNMADQEMYRHLARASIHAMPDVTIENEQQASG